MGGTSTIMGSLKYVYNNYNYDLEKNMNYQLESRLGK